MTSVQPANSAVGLRQLCQKLPLLCLDPSLGLQALWPSPLNAGGQLRGSPGVANG